MTEIKRLNYFTSQFLVEKDFTDEQAYHIQKRRLHNQWLHSWGIAGDGLQVGKKAAKSIEISKGIAIDRNGNEVVLLDPVTVDLSNNTANATVWVTARFEEVKLPDDHYPGGAADHYTRLTERTNIELGKEPQVTDGSVILLATVTLDASGNIAKIANDVRRLAGSLLSPATRVGPPTPVDANTLDVLGAPRTTMEGPAEGTDKKWTAKHPTGLALYVTANNLEDGRGVEFRHTNGGQGIGFGWNTIYATGSNPNQPLNLKARGTGKLTLTGNTDVIGGLTVTADLAVNTISPTGRDENQPLNLKARGTGGLTLTGNTTVSGRLEITGDATIARSLTVTGDATLAESLTVTGNVILAKGLTMNGDAYVAKSLTVTERLVVNAIDPTGVLPSKNPMIKLWSSGRVDILQEDWKVVGADGAPALQGTWAKYPDANFDSPAYFKDSLGIVHLRGLVQNPNEKNDSHIASIIFTLPANCRPENTSVHIVASGHPTQTPPAGMPLRIYGRVDVQANGDVVAIYGRPNDYVSLAGISFRAK